MSRSTSGDKAVEALASVTSSLINAEERQGQIDMVHAVAEALASGRSIIVQAGTGTGKSLGYLIPAILSGKKTVVATATKALQDQLNNNDLPMLANSLSNGFSWAVVKGRNNYLCRQRVSEISDPSDQLFDTQMTDGERRQLEQVIDWARDHPSGDLEELAFPIGENPRKMLTVGPDQCPGRNRCPQGQSCFAEIARDRAQEADVVVVNLHLYGLHLASDGNILPEHELIVFDEAHQLEAVLSDTVGTSLSAGRVNSVASSLRTVLAEAGSTNRLDEKALELSAVLSGLTGQRIHLPMPGNLSDILVALRLDLNDKIAMLRELKTDDDNTQQKIYRAITHATRLVESLDMALGTTSDYVFFVEGTDARSTLKVSPLHVGAMLSNSVWADHQAVLTSATIPNTLPERVGLDAGSVEILSVDSPFDYETRTRLYCSPEFPDRNSPDFTPFVHNELESLITAAGGRTLALFTSNKALREAVTEMRNRLPFTILTPSETPRHNMIERFMNDESSCIFASQSFFQGVDLPGRTLSLVVLDKLPFPRPDEPLLEARRDAVGRALAFQAIDLPIAATSLAQAAGRLMRTSQDSGVVAVLDRRLATAGYWRTLIGALPPMTRTRNRSEVEDFLRRISESTKS